MKIITTNYNKNTRKNCTKKILATQIIMMVCHCKWFEKLCPYARKGRATGEPPHSPPPVCPSVGPTLSQAIVRVLEVTRISPTPRDWTWGSLCLKSIVSPLLTGPQLHVPSSRNPLPAPLMTTLGNAPECFWSTVCLPLPKRSAPEFYLLCRLDVSLPRLGCCRAEGRAALFPTSKIEGAEKMVMT